MKIKRFVESKMIISFGILPFYQNYYKIIQKTLYNPSLPLAK